MFNDAPLAVLLDGPVALQGDLAVLDVELLQAPAVVGDALDAAVRDELARAHAQLLEVGAALGERAQAGVAHVALADVERPEARARPGQHRHRVVAHCLAAAGVQVPARREGGGIERVQVQAAGGVEAHVARSAEARGARVGNRVDGRRGGAPGCLSHARRALSFLVLSVSSPQFITPPAEHLEPRVGHLVALGHGQVAQRRAQLGELVQAEVRHLAAVRHAQLAQLGAEAGHKLDAGVWKKTRQRGTRESGVLWGFQLQNPAGPLLLEGPGARPGGKGAADSNALHRPVMWTQRRR